MGAQIAGPPTRAAAAAPVMPLVHGPGRPGRVLGALGQAVIIGLDTAAGPRVLSLLTRGATGVPNGVRLGSTSALAGVLPDTPAWVGAGDIRAGELHVRVVRSWPTRVRRVTPDPRAVAVLEAAARAGELGVPATAVVNLTRALQSQRQQRPDAFVERAASALVGLGAGLTPGGDDVLAGMFIGLHATGRPDLARSLGDRLLDTSPARTTVLSADLLRLAAGGDGCLDVLAVVQALHAPLWARSDGWGRSRLQSAVHRLLSVGHTSGADLTTGLALGLQWGMTEQHPVACDGVVRRHSGQATAPPVAPQEVA